MYRVGEIGVVYKPARLAKAPLLIRHYPSISPLSGLAGQAGGYMFYILAGYLCLLGYLRHLGMIGRGSRQMTTGVEVNYSARQVSRVIHQAVEITRWPDAAG